MAEIRDKNGKLLALECERCKDRLTSGPHVVDSGWIKVGQRIGDETFEWHYCWRCKIEPRDYHAPHGRTGEERE